MKTGSTCKYHTLYWRSEIRMVRDSRGKKGYTPNGQGKRFLQKKKTQKRTLLDAEEQSPVPRKVVKTNDDAEEEDFSYIRFKFLLRSPETVVKGLQTFLDICGGEDEEEEGRKGLQVLESYLKSSPQCSEVLDLLTPKASSQVLSLVFTWLKLALQKCPSMVKTFQELQQHLVRTLLTQHSHLIVNSLRQGNKTGHIKSTLSLLLSVASLGGRFAKQLHTHLDFTHSNWPGLLSRRDRKDEIDVRACMTALLMTLLQVEDAEVTKSLVDHRVLLQDVLMGLKYDRCEYVIHSLNTIHRCIVMNGAIGKNSKMYLFNSPVLKELLALYQWPGPSQWKCQPSDDANKEYTEEQQKVAEYVHPVLVDLLTNHKLGICFRDRFYGLSENKNSAVNKVLQLLVMSYASPCPLLTQLVVSILRACPDQTAAFLRLLQSHLSPRPVHSWIACLRFFLKIIEIHDWPSDLMTSIDMMTEERVVQVVHFLFPPEPIISSLKEGLKSTCATVRHQCLQALEVVATRGGHFLDISRRQLGCQAPVTLGIEGLVSRTIPNGQVMQNLQQKMLSLESFAVPISRDLCKDKDVVLPHVSRFQHLLAILRMYTLAPEHLVGGPADTLPCLLQLVARIMSSEEDLDRPPEGTVGSLPSLYLLQALAQCDAKKLNLFGKGGNKADPRNSLVYQLVCLLQVQRVDDTYSQTARSLIVKLLAGTGLFEGLKEELAVWLRHLEHEDLAPSEVVTFFVGLLRQYMTNPYPAIDRLMELVEEDVPQVTDGVVASVRQEFSPLVMFALEGDFHMHKKVHQYLCKVLIDILHTLHKPEGFSRLVHALSSNLDPEVTLYLTLHRTDEKLTSESLLRRVCKKTRIKQLKTFIHAGVTVLKKLLKEEEEVVKVVESLSPNACMPLIQQCLHYLHELVCGSSRTQGELLNKKLGEVCLETVRAACLYLSKASADTTTTTITTTKVLNSTEQTNRNIDDLNLPKLDTDWFQPAMTCLLSHPLVCSWLFEEGFQQGSISTKHVVMELCSIIQFLRLGECNVGIPFDVTSKCRCMLQLASGSAEMCRFAENIQPLLCQCMETLFSMGDHKDHAEVLLTLVSLPVENFMAESTSKRPSPLAETVCRLAVQMQPDSKMLEDLSCRVDVKSSFKGLFTLVSFLDSAPLMSLALCIVHSSPEVLSACSVTVFQGMLKRVERNEASELFPLLECVIMHNTQCRVSCAQWLQKKRKSMRQGKPLYHSIMLLYLQQFVKVEDSVEDDLGVKTIAEVVVSKLDCQEMTVSQLDPTLIHVACYLINLRKIERSLVDKLQDALLSAMGMEATLHRAHIQLLAATLREQSLHATCPSQTQGGGNSVGNDIAWDKFVARAGQVLLVCVRYLTGSGRRMASRKEEGKGESCNGIIICLCHHLLCLPVPPEVRTSSLSFWPDVVTCCLKHHYKDVQYITLLRQLVQRLFIEEEQASKHDNDLDDVDEEEEEDENERIVTDSITRNETSDEDRDSEEEDDKPIDKNSVDHQRSKSTPNIPAAMQRKVRTLSTIVNETARRLRLNEKSAIARKCVALFDDESRTDLKSNQSEIVRRWTQSKLQTFFLWPCEFTSVSSRAKTVKLATPGNSKLLVDLCEKVVGHTGFLSVMQEAEHREVRGELVGLLAYLVRLHHPCCSVLPLSVLVAAYGATLSLTDQNLLYLMLACDQHGNQRFIPGLWGEHVVKDLEARKEMGRTLLLETSLESILQILNLDVMATSILHFPLLRSMEFNVSESAVRAERMLSHEDCYDPRFLLQLFFHFMGPEHIVDVRSFISRKALGFTLVALSSHDMLTRQMAVGILANFHSHLETVQRWTGAPILLAVLKVVMNGMTKEGQKLPSLVTLFLAKAADLILSPESDMYVVIHSFLMLKPALDVSNVPEFYNFFNSSNPKERLWILRLLQEGLRDTSDHRLFQRRFIYKLLMCHASSSLSDPQTRRESLKVLVKACSISTVVRDVVTTHGLLAWFLAFLKDAMPDTLEMTRLACQLLHSVCYTPEFNQQRLWWLTLPRLSRRCLLHVPLLSCITLLLHSFTHMDEQSLSLLEDIVQHPHLANPLTPSLLPHKPH